MRRGGIYDQLGFGFHRYSTDAEWLVPHFEKMLYDQALLAEVYAEAFVATGRREFGRTAAEIADYVLRDLASPEGGFYSAEDADSEGEEGQVLRLDAGRDPRGSWVRRKPSSRRGFSASKPGAISPSRGERATDGTSSIAEPDGRERRPPAAIGRSGKSSFAPARSGSGRSRTPRSSRIGTG